MENGKKLTFFNKKKYFFTKKTVKNSLFNFGYKTEKQEVEWSKIGKC